jgi:probable HAF family extracellular repeat protein
MLYQGLRGRHSAVTPLGHEQHERKGMIMTESKRGVTWLTSLHSCMRAAAAPRGTLGLVLLLPVLLSLAPQAHAQRYTLTDLGTLGSGLNSYGTGINASGQVTGCSDTTPSGDEDGHAFIYGDGTMSDIGTLGSDYSYSCGNGINERGQVVGVSVTNETESHAFLYTPATPRNSSTMVDLGTLGGTFGFTGSEATGINAGGQVTGYANTVSGQKHAFLYSNGTMQDLGTLGGNSSEGEGINASGQVTGDSDTGSYDHAFLYGNSTMQDLVGTFGPDSYGLGINASGQVTGYFDTGNGNSLYHAFLYSNGKMSDLNTLDTSSALAQYVTLTAGTAINDNGWIVANGQNRLGPVQHNHAYLLRPIPSPSILWQNTTGEVVRWFMNGGAIAASSDFGAVPSGWTVQGVGDFIGNGNADMLWRNTTGDVVIWYMSAGTLASSADLGVVPSSWTIQGTADFNGDGVADILWRNANGDVVIWFMYANGTIGSSVDLGIVSNNPVAWSIQGTGDFNGDGTPDILWRNANGDVVVWLMGTPPYQVGKIASSADLGVVPSAWTIQGTGDFNGDGKTDILWRNANGDVVTWLMNGGAIAASADLGVIPSTWSIRGTGYFDSDAKSDILWRNANGDVVIWFMNGGTIASSADLGVIPTTWTIQP